MKITIKDMGVDKQLHLLSGWAIQSLFNTDYIGFLVVIVVAASKELIWDKWLGKGTPDKNDFWATLAGAILYLILTTLKTILYEKIQCFYY